MLTIKESLGQGICKADIANLWPAIARLGIVAAFCARLCQASWARWLDDAQRRILAVWSQS